MKNVLLLGNGIDRSFNTHGISWQELLEKMTDQKFATYDAAVTWWNANSRRFDYDMQEKPEE